jgi:1-acyl-sn-glycerol-3-phosphate acyltransferase
MTLQIHLYQSYFQAKIRQRCAMTRRRFLKKVFGLLFWSLTKLEVSGMENIPNKGGGIIAPNHLGVIDAPLVFVVVERNDITALVAKKHRKNPLFKWVVNGVDGIWLNREEADTAAIRAARSHLQNGGLLGIAPEGTRSKTGGLIPGKTGVAYLAEKAGVPIVPAAITGTYQGIKKVLRLQRPHILIRFGEPFMLPPVDRNSRDASLKMNTDEIMCRIAAMLPPEHRGIYTDHPRVKELLGKSKSPVEVLEEAPNQ